MNGRLIFRSGFVEVSIKPQNRPSISMSALPRITLPAKARLIGRNALKRKPGLLSKDVRVEYQSRGEWKTQGGVSGVHSWSFVGALVIYLSSCSPKDAGSPRQAPQHVPPESSAKVTPNRLSNRNSSAKLFLHEIERRPLENHLIVDPTQFESLTSKMKEGSGVGKLVRLISFDARVCTTRKHGKDRRSAGWLDGTRETVATSGENFSTEEQKAMLAVNPYRVGRDAVIIYEALVLDLPSWGIYGRQGDILPMHRHMLAPEESDLSGFFWRVPKTLICQQPQSQWTQPRVAFALGKSGFSMVLSLGSSLKDYAMSIEEWSRWRIGWPEECKSENGAPPEEPLDWPAFDSRFAFGGFTQPIENTEADLSDFGLTCKLPVKVYRRRGVFGKTSKSRDEKRKTKGSATTTTPASVLGYGQQTTSPYVWGIISTEPEKIAAIGNFSKAKSSSKMENKEKKR